MKVSFHVHDMILNIFPGLQNIGLDTNMTHLSLSNPEIQAEMPMAYDKIEQMAAIFKMLCKFMQMRHETNV